MPDAVITCLEAAIGKVAEKPEFQEAMARAGFGVNFRGAQDTAVLMERRSATWRPIAEEIKSGATK